MSAQQDARRMGASDPATWDRSRRFGQVVRAYRRAAGLSQEALARRAGCDRQSVNRVENAAYAPSLPRVLRLADALGVDVRALLAPEVPDLPNQLVHPTHFRSGGSS